MSSSKPPLLQWVLEDQDGSKQKGLRNIRLLLIGEKYETKLLAETIVRRAEKEEKIADNLGQRTIGIEIFMVPTLNMYLEDIMDKRLDYLLLLLNPAEQSCLDRAETEFSRVHVMFLASRRVEIYLTQRSAGSMLSTTQLDTFCERYQDPPISSIQFGDISAIEFAVSILYNRLRKLKNISY